MVSLLLFLYAQLLVTYEAAVLILKAFNKSFDQLVGIAELKYTQSILISLLQNGPSSVLIGLRNDHHRKLAPSRSLRTTLNSPKARYPLLSPIRLARTSSFPT
jgi:hypothetical protein